MSVTPPRSTDVSSAKILVLLAALAALPYLNGIGGDFTYDDIAVIRDNPVVRSEPLGRLLTFVYRPGGWRPLTMLTYGLNDRLSDAAWGYHVVNVALHAAVTCAVFGVARLFLPTAGAALIAAVVFAVHPVHTEAVTGIVGRAELLAALAVLLSLLCAARALRPSGRRRRLWQALSAGCFLAGLFAKESAFTGIGLLLVLQVWLEPRASLRRRAAFCVPYLVAGAVYLGLRMAVVGSLTMPEPPKMLDNPLAYVSGGVRVRTAVVVLWDYLALLAVPLRLSADYSYNEIALAVSWWDSRFLCATAVLLSLGVAVLLLRRRSPHLLLAALFLAIPLALTSNLALPIGTIKAERLLYLPSLGWCLAVGLLATAAIEQRRRAAVAALAVLVGLFAARTWIRNRDWRDDFALFRAAVAASPGSAKAHHNVAVAYDRNGDLDTALLHYRRALRIDPDYADAAYGLAHVHHRRGHLAAALAWYARAVELDWSLGKAHLQIGIIRNRLGEYEAAEAALRSGLRTAPNDPLLLVNLSASLLAQGDAWEAVELLERLDDDAVEDPEEQALVAAARVEIEEALP